MINRTTLHVVDHVIKEEIGATLISVFSLNYSSNLALIRDQYNAVGQYTHHIQVVEELMGNCANQSV